MSDYKEPLPTELEQIVDEARRDGGLGPLARDPATGIKDMDARIGYFTTLKGKLEAQRDKLLTVALKPTAHQKTLAQSIADCDRQLVEARARRSEYELQARSTN